MSRLRTRLNPKLARHTATGIDVQFSIFAELWAKEVGHTIAAPEITSSSRSDRLQSVLFRFPVIRSHRMSLNDLELHGPTISDAAVGMLWFTGGENESNSP